MLARTRGDSASPSRPAGMQNGVAAFQDGSLASFKTELALATQSGSHTSCLLPKVTENLCPHKNLRMDAQPCL